MAEKTDFDSSFSWFSQWAFWYLDSTHLLSTILIDSRRPGNTVCIARGPYKRPSGFEFISNSTSCHPSVLLFPNSWGAEDGLIHWPRVLKWNEWNELEWKFESCSAIPQSEAPSSNYYYYSNQQVYLGCYIQGVTGVVLSRIFSSLSSKSVNLEELWTEQFIQQFGGRRGA